MKQNGIVYLVGAGPGDPGLLTVRGQQLLRQADVVVYDHLVNARLLAHCSANAKRIYVGKESDHPDASQAMINRLLIREARAGQTVVRLKGGDPFLFGRGGEEALALAKARIRFEIVPGVTSAIAVPAYAGIPLTHRGYASSVGILTGHEDPAKGASAIRWDQLATGCDTVVCLMAVRTLPRIVAQLVRHGRAAHTPCAIIEWGTYPTQRTLTGTLRTMTRNARRAAIRPPAILIVGDVVRLRSTLRWFESKPLFGKRILVTRASVKRGSLTEQLESLGAHVEALAAIEQAPIHTNGQFAHAVQELAQTDWVFFTSPEGVAWFQRLLKPLRKDLRKLAGCHIAAIGPKTAEAIESLGLHVDFIPSHYRQEGLLDELPSRLLKGKRAVIFAALDSRDTLEAGLRQRGMQVRNIPVYQTIRPKGFSAGVKLLFQRPFHLVTVTSASCVHHLHEALRAGGRGAQFRHLRFASIGPVTSQAIRSCGGRVAIEASVSTIEGLVDAIVRGRR